VRVRFQTSIAGLDFSYRKGQEVDVGGEECTPERLSEKQAKAFLEGGHVELIKAGPREATKPRVSRATKGRRRS